ncbi:LOW QUALITY PROTEIN: uncharacterized protein LOC121467710, partial [Drosophila elegans]|uniref:LOW QUALITY PROTEIN: uncharacterized protein LOC121467710 n=1 Tax=Drosophila elegans TaxID=30023 RepID=UPI001BC8498D
MASLELHLAPVATNSAPASASTSCAVSFSNDMPVPRSNRPRNSEATSDVSGIPLRGVIQKSIFVTRLNPEATAEDVRIFLCEKLHAPDNAISSYDYCKLFDRRDYKDPEGSCPAPRLKNGSDEQNNTSSSITAESFAKIIPEFDVESIPVKHWFDNFELNAEACGLNIKQIANRMKKVTINGVEVECLVDTGANVSVLRKFIFNKIPYLILEKSESKLRGLGKKITCPIGRFFSDVAVDEVTTSQSVVVIDDEDIEYDALLGYDFVSKFSLSFSAEGYKFSSLQGEKACEEPNQMSIYNIINTSDEIDVPSQYAKEVSMLIKNYKAADLVAEVPVKLRIVPDGEIITFRQSPSRFAIAEENDVEKQIDEWLITDCVAFKQTLQKADEPRAVRQWIIYPQDFGFAVEHRPQMNAFQSLKDALTKEPYWSKKTTEAESRQHSYILEAKAVYLAVKKFRHYLLGSTFRLITDCVAFKQTLQKADVPRAVRQWIIYLQDFEFAVEHRPGERLKHVDCLSRYPNRVMLVSLEITARIKNAQGKDEMLKAIMEILASRPYEGYKMKGGLVYKEINGNDLLVVPKVMEKYVIVDAHNSGHFALQKTVHAVQQSYWIPHLEQKTVDTGATASFISKELADRLQAAGKVGPTKRQVRMADGRCGDVKSQLEIQIGLGTRKVSMELLILPGLIDELVLGWNFLTKIGAEVKCAGHRVMIPARDRHRGWLEEKLSVAVVEAAKEFSEKDVDQFLKTELESLENLQGTSNVAVHRITMKDDQPVKQRYYPKNPKMQGEINAKVDELLEKGCIEPSRSPYSSPIVMVRKKTGKWRLWVDFRQINAKSVKDAYPMPMINYILDQLREAKYISSLDLKDGYWQIPLEAASRQYTAFTVPGKGLFQWKVMPFGLHSASATFQRALDQVIGPEMMPHAFAYQDDIIVIGRTLEEHMRNLKEVFRRLRAANLKVNADKCKFFRKELQYLGHRITDQGIGTDPEKVSAIALLKPPANVKELRQYLGVASWYRRFVPDFATLVHPLNALLRKGVKWEWTDDHQQAFEAVKARLVADPTLACPDFTKPFVLQTDASDYGLGAILTQNSDQGERVISYSSRTLNGSEKSYSATEKECLAIVWAIRKLKPYLEGYHFKVITDHMALKWLNSIESPTGRIARWALELQQYDFEITYRKGQLNIVADALSRQPLPETCRRVKTKSPGQSAEQAECSWIRDIRGKIAQNPQKYPDYLVEADRLYRHIPHRAGNEDVVAWKLCVPIGSRQRVMVENHDTPTAGHMGSRKTIARVAARYYWPGMHRDIRKHVRNCESCLRYKPSQLQAAGKMLTQIPEEPWATVCADFVGPLPRSKHGNSMLLVLVDRFSKWTEIVPMRRATTETLEKAIRERIVSRYGVPKVLITDNGVQFTSRAFKRFLTELGVRHQFTAPYTPLENPTERANRTVKTMIAQFAGRDQRTWDEKWPELQLAVNTSVAESTGYSPAFVTQGREPRLPSALFDEETTGTGRETQTPSENAKKINEIFELVRRNMEKAAQDQARTTIS